MDANRGTDVSFLGGIANKLFPNDSEHISERNDEINQIFWRDQTQKFYC